jgi:hypothetical protein
LCSGDLGRLEVPISPTKKNENAIHENLTADSLLLASEKYLPPFLNV